MVTYYPQFMNWERESKFQPIQCVASDHKNVADLEFELSSFYPKDKEQLSSSLIDQDLW